MELNIVRKTDTATLPVKAHKGDLGYDIFSDENKTCTDSTFSSESESCNNNTLCNINEEDETFCSNHICTLDHQNDLFSKRSLVPKLLQHCPFWERLLTLSAFQKRVPKPCASFLYSIVSCYPRLMYNA